MKSYSPEICIILRNTCNESPSRKQRGIVMDQLSFYSQQPARSTNTLAGEAAGNLPNHLSSTFAYRYGGRVRLCVPLWWTRPPLRTAMVDASAEALAQAD